MLEKKNNMKIETRGKYCLLLFLLIVSCFPEHKEIYFEKETLKIGYCNDAERIDRINISIRSLNSSDRFKWIETIQLIDNKEGKNYIYLTKPNQNYEGYLKQINANSEYRLNLPFSDISSFIVFQTDENARIFNIQNDFSCK